MLAQNGHNEPKTAIEDIARINGSPRFSLAANPLISPGEMHYATQYIPSFSLRRGGGRNCLISGSCPKVIGHRLLQRCCCLLLVITLTPHRQSGIMQGDNASVSL